jgi:hypothetical protein
MKKILIGLFWASLLMGQGGNGAPPFVSSFNTRTGAVTLTSGDVTTALGFTPATSSVVTISTSSTVTVSAVGFYLNNASGAVTYNLPAITSAMVNAQFCFRNAVTRSGAVTIQLPAATFMDNFGANGSAAGTLVSTGALADSVCVVAVSTTQYIAYIGLGNWTNN